MSFFSNRRQSEPPPPPPKPQAPPTAAPAQPVGFETVLGANTTLEGTLRSNANVRLDGTFTGTLEINGNVLVGETAKITADIHAKNVSIAGAVRGNVSGKKVQLLRTGRIWGDIHAAALTTEEGAFIDGKITMMSQETPPGASKNDDTETATKESSMFKLALDPPNTPVDPDAISPSITPTGDPVDPDAISPSVTPTGDPVDPDALSPSVTPTGAPTPDPQAHAGATEADLEEVEAQRSPGAAEHVENISTGHEGELPVGGDWTEGQTNADFGHESPGDEPKQST
jgi:cytoskeletal protein CcmA (bactofilin family)